MYSLYNIVICIGTGVIIISLVLALNICNKKYSPSMINSFFICPLIALLLSANTITHDFFLHYNNRIHFTIQNILFLFDLIYWTSFFLKLFNAKVYSKRIIFIILITLLIASLTFFVNDLNRPNLYFSAIFNICKCLFCILFYHKLFKIIPNKIITNEPSFWFVTGLFFYSCISIPFYTLHNYIKEIFQSSISLDIFAISNILIIVMHIFFIKAYLCIVQQRKEL